MNPFMLEVILKEKGQDMLKEAEHKRILAIYSAANPDFSRRAKLKIALGGFFLKLIRIFKRRSIRQLDLD